MNKFLLVLFMVVGAITPLSAAKIIVEEELPHRKIIKIEFEGHTYICFHACYSPGFDSYAHDPDCEKCKSLKDANK